MKNLRILLLLSLFSSLPIFANGAQMRMYSCMGEDFDFTLEYFFAENDYDLNMMFQEKDIDMSQFSVKAEGDNLRVKGASAMGQFSFIVTPPQNTDVPANENGMIEYGVKTSTLVSLKTAQGDQTISVECQAYDFVEEFFERLFSAFP